MEVKPTEHELPQGKYDSRTEMSFETATTHFNQGRLEDAIKSYKKILSHEPGCIEAQVNLAHAEYKRGKREHNVAEVHVRDGYIAYETLLDQGVKSPEIFIHLTEAYFVYGNLPAAMEVCQEGLALYAEDHRLHSWMGSLLYKTGYLEKSLESHNRSLEIMPENNVSMLNILETYRSLIRSYYEQAGFLGDKSLRDKDIEARMEVLKEKASEHAEGLNPDSFFLTAICYLESSRFDDALGEFKRLLSLRPGVKTTKEWIGHTYFLMTKEEMSRSGIDGVAFAYEPEPWSGREKPVKSAIPQEVVDELIKAIELPKGQ